MIINFLPGVLQASLKALLKKHLLLVLRKSFSFVLAMKFIFVMLFLPQGKISDQVYNYPEGLGEVLYREQFDFNAEPPWEPS